MKKIRNKLVINKKKISTGIYLQWMTQIYKDSMQSRMDILHKVHTMKYTGIRNKKQIMYECEKECFVLVHSYFRLCLLIHAKNV